MMNKAQVEALHDLTSKFARFHSASEMFFVLIEGEHFAAAKDTLDMLRAARNTAGNALTKLIDTPDEMPETEKAEEAAPEPPKEEEAEARNE